MRAVSIPAQVLLGPLGSRRLLGIASDTTLVEQMRRGNEAAFTVAFERHAGGLLGFCRHMVGSPQDAEDAVQHTFLAAFRELARSSRRELALKPWLYAVARNRCLSILRSRREQAALDFDLPAEGLAEQVERRAELRDLLRDLRELPEDQRAALLLAEAGDLSHAEVAGVLGCEVAKVKALVFSARTALIHRREARETACAVIREQVATLRGNSLRRSALRHHLRSCDGCRAYSEQVRRQQRMLAAALPVVLPPGLRSSLHASACLGGGSLGGGLAAGIGTGLSASVGAGTLAKVVAVGLIVGGAATAGEVLIADAERLIAPPPKATGHATALSRPKPSPADVSADRAVRAGVRQTESGAAEGGAHTPRPEQRPGSVPPSATRPAGAPGPREGHDEYAAPSGDGETDVARDHGDAADPVGWAAHGGEAQGKDGPPAGTPSKDGPPAGTPSKDGPAAGTPDQRGQTAGAPGAAGQPPGAPATHRTEAPPPGQDAPEPAPDPGQRAPATAPGPAPGTTPGPHPPPAPSPPNLGRPGI